MDLCSAAVAAVVSGTNACCGGLRLTLLVGQVGQEQDAGHHSEVLLDEMYLLDEM